MATHQTKDTEQKTPAFPRRVSLYETEEGLALLKDLARRRGVSSTDLLRMLIREEAERVGIALPGATSTRPRAPARASGTTGQSIWSKLAERAERVPEEEIADLPEDLSKQHDHYAYGAPKRR